MTDTDRDPDRQAEAAPTPSPAEPTTARALWPTFMRRTLAEDSLGRTAAPAK